MPYPELIIILLLLVEGLQIRCQEYLMPFLSSKRVRLKCSPNRDEMGALFSLFLAPAELPRIRSSLNGRLQFF